MYEFEEFVDLELKLIISEEEPLHINWGNIGHKEEETNISFVLDFKQSDLLVIFKRSC